jgi:hypothetical protein
MVLAVALVAAACVPGAHALEALADSAMSSVAGQDGVDFGLVNGSNTAAITMTKLQAIGGSAASPATTELNALTLNGIGLGGVGVGAAGSALTGAYGIKTSFDAGSSGATPAVGLGLFWGKNYASTFASDTITTSRNALRAQATSVDLLDATNSVSVTGGNYGTFAFDSSGSLRIGNLNGLLSSTPESAADTRQLRLTIGSPQFGVAYASAVPSYGQFFYRQGAAGTGSELVLDHLYLDVGFTPGTGGILGTCLATSGSATARCGGSSLFGSAPTAYPATAASSYGGWFNGFSANNNGGIYVGTSHLDFNFAYDISYRGCSTGSPCSGGFTTASNLSPVGHLGWSGGFNYAELLLGTGGMWTNVTSYNPDNPSDNVGADCTPACTGATRANGLNIAFHGNYDPNFTWYVGDAAGTGAAGGRTIAFGSWTTLPGAAWSLSAPNITLDPLNSGQGPGGLCWGAQGFGTAATCTGSTTKWVNNSQSASNPGTFLNLAPMGTTLGLSVRDLSLQAYSSSVLTLDDKNNNGQFDAGESNSYNWGLIYTFGQLDQNMYIYPGNSGNYGDPAVTAGNGITMDWLLMAQSFGTYPVFKPLVKTTTTNALLGNTNLMIADTSYLDSTGACTANLNASGKCPFGIGLIQSNLLIGAHRMNLALEQGGIRLTSGDVRMELEGLLAGGPVPNLTYQYLQQMFYSDVNVEMTQMNLALVPAKTSNGYPYVGFTNRVTLGDTTLAPTNSTIGVPESSPGANGCAGLNATSTVDCNYISLAEPSSPTTDFRIADITGDMYTPDGQLAVYSAADAVNSPDAKPRLVFAQSIQIGSTVPTGTTAPLTGFVKFGGTTLGSIVIPSGQAYMSMTLKPQ